MKEVTRQNIDKVVARGEKLDDLQAKAEGLEYEAKGFRKGAIAVRRKEGCNYCKVNHTPSRARGITLVSVSN